MPEHQVVGHSVHRRDAAGKVSGHILHVGNIEMSDLLQVAVLRSPYPHARITRIEKSRAEAAQGVALVLTGAELAAMPGIDPYVGPAFQDQPILAIDRVRHVGEPVAAVAAVDLRSAEAALQLIEVDYQPLPAVFDVLEAARSGSPLIHEELRPAGAFADLAHMEAGERSNICYRYKLRTGDVEKAFAEADRVFEDTFTSPPAQHMTMEPHVSLAYLDEGDRVNVWTASQSPSSVRSQLAIALGLPLNRIRVRVPSLGGGYGAKLYAKLEPLVALMALKTRRPVRYSLKREEVFQTITKHGAVIRLKTGVRDGLITGRHCDVLYDTGAYADIGPRIVYKSGYTSSGPYRIPNVWIDSHCVYTNKPPAGAFRGFGVPQITWAYESQMDIIARALGIDPVEFRMRHALEEGEPFATGTPVTSFGLKESIQQAAQAIDWSQPETAKDPKRPRGKGIASGVKAVLTPSISGAVIIMNADGSVQVLSSTVEMGQGSDTTLAQIAAEELGVGFEQVHIVHPDTDVTPYDTITAGSRSTYHMGNAIRMAAVKIKAQLFGTAAKELEVAPEDLVARDGRIFVAGSEENGMTLHQVFLARFGSLGTTITGEAIFQPSSIPTHPKTGRSDKCTEYWFPSASSAEVEVDVETGQVKVLKLFSAGDVGTAINPRHCQQQLLGSAAMQLGLTLFEEMLFEEGQLLNGSLLNYQILSFKDLPGVFEPILVEVPHETGPFGAKGVGETGTLSVSPAIANAVEDAVGIRIRDLPITPERVLRGLAERDRKQQEAGGSG